MKHPPFFLEVLSEANKLAVPCLSNVWDDFSKAATRYKKEYGKFPVLIIDNADRLTKGELGCMQGSAKDSADFGPASVVFVGDSSVPRYMKS